MDMNQYLEIFIEESKEHLQALSKSLLILEQNPEDISMLNEIFRSAHTLKGMAGTMGFTKMTELTHHMEDVLHALRSNEIKVTSNVIDLLFKCLDALENYVGKIIESSVEGEAKSDDILQTLSYLLINKHLNDSVKTSNTKSSTDDNPSNSNSKSLGNENDFEINQYDINIIEKAELAGLNSFQVTIKLDKGCVLKAARTFIIFKTIEDFAEITKSKPKVEDLEDEKFDSTFTLLLVTDKNDSYVMKELNSISEIESVNIINLDVDAIQNIKIAGVNENLIVDKKIVDSLHKEDTIVASSSSKAKTGKTVRVDITRLDVLMNLVSELIIIKTRLEENSKNEENKIKNEAIEYLERITTNLHDSVMKVRMVPVETVFNRFPRMIRDISKDINKEILLSMFGEETELDRTVIDEIGDPLIHLLRNSADHGIESADVRNNAGKNSEGHIYLRAYQDGNNVVIEVEDDGQGIDTEKVKKKAIERGIVSKEEADTLSSKEINEFLFRPSFSTADKITGLSGRGVGLDVVKTKIESLGGFVEVETQKGIGSKFIIRLPLTLAIIQALLVYVGSEKYAIPLTSVQQIIKVNAEDIKLIQKQEVILLRNTVVPLVRLVKELGVQKADSNEKSNTVVVVKKGDKLAGFIVDNLIGQHEIVIKSIGKLLSGVRSIAGATILGDGNVALIVDVNSLV